ncbi:MAG: hydroxyacid dehydrogenase [Synoicihabitans sp.]
MHLIFMRAPRSIFLLDPANLNLVFAPAALAEIRRITASEMEVQDRESILADPTAFADVEIVFSSWGVAVLDSEILAAMPRLRAVFHAAGTVRSFVTDAFWNRGILLTSSFPANAIPVAQYTVATIVLSLKKAWTYSRRLSHGKLRERRHELARGVYFGSKVGIVSLGAVGRHVCELLRGFDLEVVGYDPYASREEFAALGVEKMDTLEELFASCSVVSLHSPSLPETEGLITGALLASLPTGATFINTARGEIVQESEMISVLKERSDLFAVIDVVEQDKFGTSELAQMENVFLTPHIAGSIGSECYRMGAMAVDECRRFLQNQPPIARVTQESMKLMA